MFNSLARSILSQQLAVKAASVIQGRFMTLCQVSSWKLHNVHLFHLDEMNRLLHSLVKCVTHTTDVFSAKM